MSILTKILAVLLSVFSLLLVGMVVTFVGNTNNYKELYRDQITVSSGLQADLTLASEQYNEAAKKFNEKQNELMQKIQVLESEKVQLVDELRKSERLAIQYQNQANSMTSVLAGFDQSISNLQASLKETQEQLNQARAEGIKSQKELNQMTSDLYEKIVQLQSAEAERRRLLEQKKELEDLAIMANTKAKEVIAVTPEVNQMATRAPSAPVGSVINGKIVEVDGNLATLSVGSADGVTKNTRFHVTRGAGFVCDIVITNVDINRSAGILDLVVQQPQVNDIASTKEML